MKTEEGVKDSRGRGAEEYQEITSLLLVVRNAEGELKEVILAPDGLVESITGTWLMDAEAAKLVLEGFQAHGIAIVVDYHHQTEGGPYSAPDGRAPAAGWIEELRFESGRGLIGKVKWTDEARKAIRADEYRYLSPVVWVRKSDLRAVRIVSVALTNRPAIPGMERVAASEVNPRKETKTMAEEPESTGGGDLGVLIGQILSELGITDLENASDPGVALQAILDKIRGGGGAEGEGEGGEEVASDIRAALKLSDNADVQTVVAAIESLRQGGDTVATLQTQVNELRGKLAARDANDLLAPYIAKGVLHPNGNEEDKKRYERFANMARKNPDDCRAILNDYLGALPPEGQTEAPPGAGPKGKDRAGVIADEVRIYNSVERHLADLTTVVNQRLLDEKLEPLSEEENRKLVAA